MFQIFKTDLCLSQNDAANAADDSADANDAADDKDSGSDEDNLDAEEMKSDEKKKRLARIQELNLSFLLSEYCL